MKRAMRRYRAADWPVMCADCGRAIRWVAERYAFVHVEPGADHAPHVAGSVQR